MCVLTKTLWVLIIRKSWLLSRQSRLRTLKAVWLEICHGFLTVIFEADLNEVLKRSVFF
jgi:hypothetical protein